MNHQLAYIAIVTAGLLAAAGLAHGLPKTVGMVVAYLRRRRDAEYASLVNELEEERRRRAIGSDAYTRHMTICPMIEKLPKETR